MADRSGGHMSSDEPVVPPLLCGADLGAMRLGGRRQLCGNVRPCPKHGAVPQQAQQAHDAAWQKFDTDNHFYARAVMAERIVREQSPRPLDDTELRLLREAAVVATYIATLDIL
jgi:hypothetical protein